MTLPVLNAIIDFSTGPSFAPPAIFGSGKFGIGAFGNKLSVTVDVSDLVDRMETTRGRGVNSDQFNVGKMTMRIVDQTGAFNPQNVSGPYYGLLSPMRKVIITATYSATTYPIFAGYITAYDYVIPDNITEIVGHTTITAVDAFQLTNIATINAVTGAVAGETTGVRVGRILDQINWPSAMRVISSPCQTTVQADPGTSRAALNALQNLESTEYGALYIDGSGNFVFNSRRVTELSVASAPTVFDDAGGGIDYANAVWRLDDSLIWNEANFTRLGGTLQNYRDTASVAQYFLHSSDETGLMNQTDADVLANARAYVSSRSTTSVRCDSLILDLKTTSYTAGITAALALDFFSPITVTTHQPGGTALTKTEQIFGISQSITPQTWQTTFSTMKPVIVSGIFGNATYGVFGSAIFAY